MEFSEETSQKLIEYLNQEDIIEVCIKLGIFSYSDSLEKMLEKTKEYISGTMLGRFKGNRTIDKFLNVIKYYLKNNDFERFNNDECISNGVINYNLLLPIVSKRRDGHRVCNDILGFDGKRYIVKSAEGFKIGVSGMQYARDGKYNPIVASAFFRFIGQPCANNLLACEKIPYYYILSENFLKDNERIYGLNDIKFMGKELVIDENNNITHKQIISSIDEMIESKKISSDKALELSKKLKLQYAVQETLKCLICSMDQNLGNTSIIVSETENGEIKDLNISPAYDMDLSFNLGEEMLKCLNHKEVVYRITEEEKTDLISIINEFKSIEGYEEALQEILNKLNGNYVEQIFDITYQETGVNEFRNKDIRDRYGNFIMRRVAIFKEACKTSIDKNEKTKNE